MLKSTLVCMKWNENVTEGALLPKQCGIVPYGALKNFSRPHIHCLRTRREPKMKRNRLKNWWRFTLRKVNTWSQLSETQDVSVCRTELDYAQWNKSAAACMYEEHPNLRAASDGLNSVLSVENFLQSNLSLGASQKARQATGKSAFEQEETSSRTRLRSSPSSRWLSRWRRKGRTEGGEDRHRPNTCKHVIRTARLEADGGKTFTVQANMILGFPQNYRLRNEKPSNNQGVGLESQQWLKAHSLFFPLLFSSFFVTACPCMNTLLCFYKHQMYKHGKTSVSFRGVKTFGWCDTWNEVENVLQKSVFQQYSKIHKYEREICFCISSDMIISFYHTRLQKQLILNKTERVLSFLIKTLTPAIILIISEIYYTKDWKHNMIDASPGLFGAVAMRTAAHKQPLTFAKTVFHSVFQFAGRGWNTRCHSHNASLSHDGIRLRKTSSTAASGQSTPINTCSGKETNKWPQRWAPVPPPAHHSTWPLLGWGAITFSARLQRPWGKGLIKFTPAVFGQPRWFVRPSVATSSQPGAFKDWEAPAGGSQTHSD